MAEHPKCCRQNDSWHKTGERPKPRSPGQLKSRGPAGCPNCGKGDRRDNARVYTQPRDCGCKRDPASIGAIGTVRLQEDPNHRPCDQHPGQDHVQFFGAGEIEPQIGPSGLLNPLAA